MSCASFFTAILKNSGYRQHKSPKDHIGCDNCSQTGIHLSKIRCSRIPEIVLRNTELFESICVGCSPIAFEIGSGGERRVLDVAFEKYRIEETALLTLVARADPECFQLLEALCISKCHVDQAIFSQSILGDEIARQLARSVSRGCKHVRALALLHCRITACGVQLLSKGLLIHAALRILDLSHNCCGSSGAESLADLVRNCPALKTLRLRENGIGPNGAAALAAALYTSLPPTYSDEYREEGLETLDLSINHVGDHGAACLARALERNCTLLVLDISLNNVSPSGVKRAVEALERNRTLHQMLVRVATHGPEQTAAMEALRLQVASAPWAYR